MKYLPFLKGRLHDVLYILRFDLRIEDPLRKHRNQRAYLAKTLASAFGDTGTLMLLFQFRNNMASPDSAMAFRNSS